MADSAPPTDRLDPELLDRYMAGECSPDETARVQAWIAARPSHATLVAALRPRHADIGWSRLARRMGAATGVAAPRATGNHIADYPSGARPHRWPRRVGAGVRGQDSGRALAVAGWAVAVALGVGLFVHRSLIPDPRSLAREYATAAGQQLTVTLTDGTQFTLAPASRVTVAADYGHGARARRVELEGEAYFAVTHDVARPFAVRAHGVVATDVGTAFDVRAYPEDGGARIAVADGAVAVRGVEARAGDVATVGDRGVTIEHRVDVAALIAWTQGRLVFRQTRFVDVARELARRYDLEIRVPSRALGAREVTGEFSADSLEHVLAILGMSLDARVMRYGRTVVFTPREREGEGQ